MSVNHASMTTHPHQSLPSFAQAFSNHSLGSISSGNNSLPPIQGHISHMDKARGRHHSPQPSSLSRHGSEENADAAKKAAGRKRPHNEIVSASRENEHEDSDRNSPSAVRVKEEQDQDSLDPSPSPPTRPADQRPPPQDAPGAPPPSSTMPSPMKKRRMTVTGAPPLNTNVRVPADQTNSTPISPVVMGFTIQRDNPKEIEQVKTMISVKQKQKALIEQRRGSVAGTQTPNPPNPPPPSSSNEDRAPANNKGAAPSVRQTRRSPNGGAGTRRLPPSAPSQSTSAQPRAVSPNSSVFQMQQSTHMPHQSAQTLPPPPISFARRRAAQLGTKRKPADIVISPREQTQEQQFQPSIHSAPPGQTAFSTGRYQAMALPRLPNVMGGGDNIRRQPGNVPPTPTRLSQRFNSSIVAPAITISESTPRSPVASVPIASSLVPPTPAFNQTEFSGDRAAFLAPFAYFYDALNDAKQLKTWLSQQLQRSNSLAQTLSNQQDKLNETVESLVEKKLSSVYSEMAGLRRRVAELEEALHQASGRRSSIDVPSLYHGKNSQNGYSSSSGPLAHDSYTFPPHSSDHSRLRSDLTSSRVASPRGHERDVRGHSSEEHASRSHSHDGPSLQPPSSMHSRISLSSMQSPPQMYRDSPSSHSLPPPLSGHGKSSRNPSERERSERPLLTRQHSHNGSSQERDRDRDHDDASPGPRRDESSRRNSVIVSSPDTRMEDS